MCNAHYLRLTKYGDVRADIPIKKTIRDWPDTCSVPSCDNPVRCRGWCSSHHWRWLTHGDVRAEEPLRRYHSVSSFIRRSVVRDLENAERRRPSYPELAARYGINKFAIWEIARSAGLTSPGRRVSDEQREAAG